MQDGPQLAPHRRQLVHRRRRRRRQLALLDEAGGLELLQAVGEDVRPDSRQVVEQVGVALRPVHQLANDEQRPALADEAERAGDRAVLVITLHRKIILEEDLLFASIFLSKTSILCRKDSVMVASPRMKWFGLALLGAVQFMVVLDIAIVNVALPSIQQDLDCSQANLQWVISAYALVFGGFLLLGGRAADLLGRRRVFMLGLLAFAIGSLLCGLAWSETSLIGARAIQGLGAATISPAALAILMTA